MSRSQILVKIRMMDITRIMMKIEQQFFLV